MRDREQQDMSVERVCGRSATVARMKKLAQQQQKDIEVARGASRGLEADNCALELERDCSVQREKETSDRLLNQVRELKQQVSAKERMVIQLQTQVLSSIQ